MKTKITVKMIELHGEWEGTLIKGETKESITAGLNKGEIWAKYKIVGMMGIQHQRLYLYRGHEEVAFLDECEDPDVFVDEDRVSYSEVDICELRKRNA